jgi:hypothetical protein
VTAGWSARRAQSTHLCTPSQLVVAARADAIPAALRAGGIRAPATLCDERRDGDPRVDASTVRVGVRPLETRACLRHLGVVQVNSA